MTEKKARRIEGAELRRLAEERMREKGSESVQPLTVDDAQRLLHELEVHQIELEMQNAELLQARDQVETLLGKYTDLYDFAPAGYFTLDREGNIRSVNLTGASLLGIERSRLIGRPFGFFVAQEKRTGFADFLGKAFSSESREACEVSLLKEGGHQLFVLIEALAASSGQECRIAVIDIAERKSLENQLLQAQKMETVGLLAGGIAHDFNNILNVIVGYEFLLENSMREDDPMLCNLKQILAAANRGANLTKSLLDFSRKHLINPQPTEINGIIRNVDKFLKMVIGEDVRLKTAFGEEKLTVNADSGQIEQVLINLATNARHAMPDGGTLSITSEPLTIKSEFIKEHGFGEPGEYALISVTDTGTGMDRETVGKIFEPFYTTKTLGKGTGLGLSIAYSLIRQHNGYIDVSSEPNKGTTFRIYLPLTHDEHAPEELAPTPPPRRGTETILLAEDDEAVRHLTELVLTGFGYRVIPAVDGEEAVKKYLAHKEAVHLLLFDLIMPNRNGKEAYDEIRKVCPEVRVIFMSGYTANIMEEKALKDGTEIIAKPFSALDLARKVRMVLDKKR